MSESATHEEPTAAEEAHGKPASPISVAPDSSPDEAGHPEPVRPLEKYYGLFAIAIAGAFFFLFLARGGLWDPYELNVADLSRRIAVNLHGASGLALEGVDNTLPRLNELGRPQLPFSTVAMGFKFFGLYEWAGRLPLALWGLLGVLALFGAVSRLFDKRAALFTAIVLVTTPVYFVHARTMLGDICVMAGVAMAFSGLAVATFDFADKRVGVRAAWGLLGIVGLLVGFASRGGLLGLAVPGMGVGLAWALARANGAIPRGNGLGDGFGALSLGVGVLGGYMAITGMYDPASSKNLNLWVGAMVKAPSRYPTFDYYIAAIGHAMAPWSAFLPFALGRIFFPPRGSEDSATRATLARSAVLCTATVALVAHGLLAARTEPIAFAAPAVTAIACAVAIRDYELGAHPSVAVGVGTAVFAGLLFQDMTKIPEKAFQAFSVGPAAFPDGFKATSGKQWAFMLGVFAVVAFFTWVERDSDRRPLDLPAYKSVLASLRKAFGGALVLLWGAVVVGAAVLAIVVKVGVSSKATWLPVLGAQVRDAISFAWLALLAGPIVAVYGLYVAADLWLLLSGHAARRRAAIFVGVSVVVGAVACFSYYPALAGQLSPKEVFETYQKTKKGNEPLGVLGVGGRTAAYYAGGQPVTLSDPDRAIRWLREGGRRFVATRAEDLPRLNRLYREQHETKTNIPVLDSRSSQILLVSSTLEAGEKSSNPLDRIVLAAAPTPQRKLDVNLDDKLMVLGTDLTDLSGKPVESVSPGKKYLWKTYFRVLEPLSTEWEMFIHIDGFRRRHNADHKIAKGKYPLSMWSKGDIIVDEYELSLEPNFTPGNYSLFFGLYTGETRMKVKAGPNDNDNRINAGALKVL